MSDAAGSRRRETLWIAARATVYASGFVALWAFVALSLRRIDSRLGVALPSWLVPVGWAIGTVGAAVAVGCIVVFVKEGRGTPALFDSPRELVARGPYRFVRNPMYVGGLGVLLGTGLALGSPSIVALSCLLGLLAHGLVVFHEEPRLERLFGESYLTYKRSVNRWWPRAPSRREARGMRH